MKWINVNDSVPDHYQLVLIRKVKKDPKYDVSFYSGGGWAFENANDVSHWAEITPPEDV